VPFKIPIRIRYRVRQVAFTCTTLPLVLACVQIAKQIGGQWFSADEAAGGNEREMRKPRRP
jgi:hypothetical protein